MATKSKYTQFIGIGMLSLSVFTGLTACSNADEQPFVADMNELIFRPVVVGRNGTVIEPTTAFTRVDANAEEMTQVALVGYEETINNTQSNVSFTKINGVWTGGGFNWNTDDGATSFCCISPSFTICSGSARTRMKFANRYFDYTLDPSKVATWRRSLISCAYALQQQGKFVDLVQAMYQYSLAAVAVFS